MYLQVDLDDFVKLILLHVEQEVVLGDSCCVHTHGGRLKVVSLQRERGALTVNTKEKRVEKKTCNSPCSILAHSQDSQSIYSSENVADYDFNVLSIPHLYTCDQILYTLF